MSATIRNYAGVSITKGGVTFPAFGLTGENVGEATIDGEYLLSDRLTVPDGEYITLWEAAMSAKEFSQIGIRMISTSGTLQVAYRTDRRTSSTDFTALGTHQRWRHLTLTCKMSPIFFNEQTLIGHGTVASEYADSSGVPALWTTNLATSETHVIDKIMIRNPGTSDVEIERLVAK
jgi:hypothetical protein